MCVRSLSFHVSSRSMLHDLLTVRLVGTGTGNIFENVTLEMNTSVMFSVFSPYSGVDLLSAQAWMPAYASILRSPRKSLDPIKNSCFPYQA
jgi:hypothetical protein